MWPEFRMGLSVYPNNGRWKECLALAILAQTNFMHINRIPCPLVKIFQNAL